MGFPRQEYWSRLPFSSGDLPDAGIEPTSPALAGGFFTTEPLENPRSYHVLSEIILQCYVITDEETIGWRISLSLFFGGYLSCYDIFASM